LLEENVIGAAKFTQPIFISAPLSTVSTCHHPVEIAFLVRLSPSFVGNGKGVGVLGVTFISAYHNIDSKFIK
jgi:hypothetical protein